MTEQLVLDGRYRLEHFFKGGFGLLWKAYDTDEGRWVAVKVLRESAELVERHDTADEKSLEAELIARFRRECDILRGIKHPAIPAWVNQGFHEGRPYLVMEWVEGVTLRDLLERYGALKPSVVASVVVQVADALACAHRHGFIHRDLNPKNVMITKEGVVHLIDFGIALPMDPRATRYTGYGMLSPNTPGYTSPEQHRGGFVRPASDIYSLGCVAFELHTGLWPFHADAEGDLAYHHMSDRPAPPVALHAPALPAELALAVDRMLIKPIEGRLSGAEDVLAAYRPFLPAEGDPEPSPRMTHDPTLPFRVPGRAAAVRPVRQREPMRSRAVRRNGPRLQTADAEAALRAARRELTEGQGPGPHCRALERMRQDAVRAWGVRKELTAQILLTCADARLCGAESSADTDRAFALYQELVTDLDEHAAPGIREVFLSARVGAAHCRWGLGAGPDAAFDGWAAVAAETAGLAEPPADTVRRCHELGEVFIEARVRVARARALLARLPGADG
ncbi:serine/threonine-protein kinase [Streptomyces clavuligerus]|uniref:non-specific serine/threonine protein kinase n=1 Tax=Streptomyces clavuligerus TaxID=1901 RepID=B5GWS5_STRCL|nr:serine/threonine-protein kinase [Streptomyces clavuligerus]ANW16928.1 serine/threonine protein kinase [Streptomyces clavuligerus]AXU11457.1 serine/threonine protein kinase [Streptomyces clavuligerus]EDY50771.1 serine/threonine protein kinase [Streptomyces clavuligerus]EFG10548.1 Protein kinase [Streptomyces clavuligerus]MBY6301275.1 serine/threonine protein kinase [Streptomyces clavuligerus]